MRATFHHLLLAAFLLATGCGYSGGKADSGYQWKNLYRGDVRTVTVPIFANTTFQRGIELTLSKAVVTQIEANTPYKVVPRERADTILEGEIVQVKINTVSSDPRANVPQEQLFDIMVNFTWKDLRTGRILVSRRGMEQVATFYATLGEGRFVGTQAAAEKMALAIVEQMESDW